MTITRFPGNALIKVGHVNANGPDRITRSGKVIDVVESKTMPKVSRTNIKEWLIKEPDGQGNTIYKFNGIKLDQFLQRADQPDLETLLRSNQFRYNLFQYASTSALTKELQALFAGGTSIPIKGFEQTGAKIELTWTKHWD